MHEFQLSDDFSKNKIAITKIKFKNVGTLRFGYMVNLKLINSNNGIVLSTTQEKNGGLIEFILTPNSNLADNGLMVSGGLYAVMANLITPNAGVRPYIQLDIESANDLAVADFDNLTREAMLDLSMFPVAGPKITLP